MIEEKEIKALGKFQKTHALNGELNAILDVDPDFVLSGNTLVVDVDGIYVPFYASSVRSKGLTSFLIKLDGIDSEAEARTFVNKTIYGIKSELALFLKVDESELYDGDDFTGYSIIDENSGAFLGKILTVESSTENLLFIVSADTGDETLIPAVKEFISIIDHEKKVIKMNLPEGLIGLNKKQ